MSNEELWQRCFLIGLRWHTDENTIRQCGTSPEAFRGLLKGAEVFADQAMQVIKSRKELG